MKKKTRLFAAIFSLLSGQALFAQHSHDAALPEAPASGMFISYAQSQRYELTLKHGKIDPGKPAELTLYVADFATNRPLEGVEIKASAQEDPNLVLTTDAHEPGVYHLDGSFPKPQTYSLALNLNSKSNGTDLLLLKAEIGKEPPKEDEHADEEPATTGGSDWWKYGLVFLGGLALGLLFLRRKPKAGAVLLVVLSIPGAFEQAGAHGPEGHGDEDGGAAGTEVYIPKETQFLFELLTQRVAEGDFQPSVLLYGTIVPSPGGFANIVTPQNGRVISLKVSPGQKVAAGQVVAVLKPSVSQSDQVGVAAETGRLRAEIAAVQAELAAAEKEQNRLRNIADIAAKKDVQAAEARFNAARANLEGLQSASSGSAAAANGDIVLKAPAGGTVGQFTLAPGAELQAGATLFSITDLGKVFVEAQVYDKDADVVSSADKYTVTCTNDDHKTAQVRLVSAALEVNPTNQSQKVLFELQNPGGEFKIGEFVTLQAFKSKTSQTIFVPNSALSEINGKPVVFMKDAPEQYVVSYISLGEDNGTHTVVLKGIEPGERFVSAGTYQVKMMMLNQ